MANETGGSGAPGAMLRRRSDPEPETELELLEREHEMECDILFDLVRLYGPLPQIRGPCPW